MLTNIGMSTWTKKPLNSFTFKLKITIYYLVTKQKSEYLPFHAYIVLGL